MLAVYNIDKYYSQINGDEPTILNWWEKYNISNNISIWTWSFWNSMPSFFSKYKTNNGFQIKEFLFDSLRSTLGTIPNVLKHAFLDNHVKFNQKIGYILKTLNGISSFSKKTKIIDNKKFNVLVNSISMLTNSVTLYNNIPIYDYNNIIVVIFIIMLICYWMN